MEIIVPKDYSEADVKAADLKRSEYHRSTATSRASHVLDTADSYRTVILCDGHERQFAHPSVLSKYGYRRMTDYPYVMGCCDYCGENGRCQVFSHESVFAQVWKGKNTRSGDAIR